MKRTLLLLALFLVSGAATAWYLTDEGQQQKSTLLSEDRNFKVEDTDAIHKIFIAQRAGETVTLERKDGYWMYNGKYRALPNSVDNLMRAFREMQMQYIPPAKAAPAIIRDLATQGIKVELYDAENNKLKAYYIGGATVDERGTYAIMEGAEQPYVIHLPTWEGNLRFRFNLAGDRWRDKSIFAQEVDDIASVSIEYPKQKNNSFRVEKTEEGYTIDPFYDITPTIKRSLSQGRVEGFLTNFKQVIAEAFENEHKHRDSILQSIPFSIITLKDKDGLEKRFQFFPIQFQTTEEDASGTPITREQVERYFVDANSEDLMLAQQVVCGKVFWKYDAFFD